MAHLLAARGFVARAVRVALTVLTLDACAHGDAGTGIRQPAPDPVARVGVEPATVTLVPRDSIALSATAYGSAGNALSGRALVFSSANTAVATVTERGIVVAVAPGHATIQIASAERPAVAAQVDVVVQPRTYTLTITVGGLGIGQVNVAPTNGVCFGATCSFTVPEGTAVTVSASPYTGSFFGGFTGGCMGAGSCSFTMDGPRAVTATFDIVRFSLTVRTTGSGAGAVTSSLPGIDCPSVSCSALYASGAIVVLTATAAEGSAFAGWSGGGCDPSLYFCPVTVDSAITVTAAFGPIPKFTVTIATAGPGTGRVTSSTGGISCPGSCSAEFLKSSTVVLSAVPTPGSAFIGWTGNGCIGAGSSCILAVTTAHTITANFGQASASLAVSLGGTGSGSVTSVPAGVNCPGSCVANLPVGSSVTLTAVAATGSIFGGWSGACTGQAPTCTVTLPQALATTASFSAVVPTAALAVTVAGSGTGTVTSVPVGIACAATATGASGTCTSNYPVGTSVTLTATAGSGSVFAGWGGACAGSAPTCTVSLGSGQAVTASFARAPTTVSVATAGTGSGTVVSSPGGIVCPGTCSASFPLGTTVALTATPGAGSVFGGWSGGCTVPGMTCLVTLSGAVAATATFTQIVTYPVTVTTTGTGAGTVTSLPSGISCPGTCTASFPAGSSVQLTATPASGSTLSTWGGGACSGGSLTCQLSVSSATSVSAAFATLPSGPGQTSISYIVGGVTNSFTPRGVHLMSPDGLHDLLQFGGSETYSATVRWTVANDRLAVWPFGRTSLNVGFTVMDWAGGQRSVSVPLQTDYEAAYNRDIAISPDGRWMLFAVWGGPNQVDRDRVVIAALDGSGQRTIAANLTIPNTSLAWSADSREVLYTGYHAATATSPNGPDYTTAVRDIATGAQRVLPLAIDGAAFSPDGRSIAGTTLLGSYDLVVMAASDGREQARVPATYRHFAIRPRWSPDGSRIAGLVTAPPLYGGQDRWDVFVMRRDGSGFLTLDAAAVSVIPPAWSPDGQRLAFSARVDHTPALNAQYEQEVFVVNVDGSGRVRLTNNDFEERDLAWVTPPRALW